MFLRSYDKLKGSIEKSSINLFANSLKDYIDYNFSEIKALTENKLLKEDFVDMNDYVQVIHYKL